MNYRELTDRQEQEANAFPMRFAFSPDQFQEVLEYFKCSPDGLCRIPGGGFIAKDSKTAYIALFKRLNKELTDAMKDDNFLIDAIKYEIANHEYCITRNLEPAFDVLGLDVEDERALQCFQVARAQYFKENEGNPDF